MALGFHGRRPHALKPLISVSAFKACIAVCKTGTKCSLLRLEQ